MPTASRVTSAVTRVLRWAEVDSAVIYGILARVWSVIAGPVTVFLIATRFAPDLQGYYYTFNSLLALQVFAELGLGAVIIQFASHEWSGLELDGQGRIVGGSEALSRLVSLGRVAFRWYLAAGGIVAIGLSLGGYLFFSRSAYAGIAWVGPWFVLCVLSAVALCLVPAFSLMEGCNQVANVYHFRLVQSIICTLTVWAAISSRAGLWTPALSSAAGISCSCLFLATRYRNFFRPFFSRVVSAGISWRHDILPMQWRIALSWLSGYFISSLFVPVLFRYHGPTAAGQMGMTWSLLGTLATVTSAWTAAKAPRFGMLIAKKEYNDLDRLFFRVTAASIVVLVLGAIAAWLLVFLLYAFRHPISHRLLPPSVMGLFLLGHIAMHSTGPLSVYLRAHKREPFVWLSLASGVLIGACTVFLGSRFGAVGVAVGYVAVSAFFALPCAIWVWHRCRTAWHADTVKPAPILTSSAKGVYAG